MGFPIPGDVIEQRLDLNQRVIKNAAATFFMQVDGIYQVGSEVQPGDLLVVDRSLEAKDGSLVVAAIDGELAVLRVQWVNHQIGPDPAHWTPSTFEVWGVVTTLIRPV